MIVNCPTCKKAIAWDSRNKFRPFCGERCKLIDLGAWADGSYTISEEHAGDFDQDNNVDTDNYDYENDDDYQS